MRRISYFGFGANSHPHMMESIIGRVPEGEPAIVSGYTLAIQALSDVPDRALLSAPEPVSPRAILAHVWDMSFRSYTLVRDDSRYVWGTLWQITDEERELVARWELIPYGWSSNLPVEVLLHDGMRIAAETEWVYDQPVSAVVDGRGYPKFILPEADFCVA